MANLAASAVTLNNSWTEGSVTGKRRLVKELTLVLTGQGDDTDQITASVLGLTKIEEATPAVKSDNTLIQPAAPSYDGTKLFFIDLTDASEGAPVGLTGTFRLTVKGY